MSLPDESFLARPAPTAAELRRTAETFIEGPNVEYSPDEVKAARGEVPLEGPRADDALDFEVFCQRYDAWKAATQRFEAAVRAMRGGDTEARGRAQQAAVELAGLHHAFMESSQPYFKADRAE
ncbi:hypothetical protein [Xenophilus sp. Marseille-Q4582]|uniref:hypothetical protein n=1 Tax=Xenophilus sp. Marseille-Q4582 TaxID=2866600 RepID=UPI001CE46100|nr:hypothetical protein [Xenophilus sp. Marseille-Q4582]